MSTFKVGDRVKVKRLESWRIDTGIPGLAVGDVGTVADVYRRYGYIGVMFDGGDHVWHYPESLELVKARKQRPREGAYFLFRNYDAVGTRQIQGYTSISEALLAAYETSKKMSRHIAVKRNNGGTMELVAMVTYAADWINR